LKDKAWDMVFGASSARQAGRARTLRGLREGDRTETYMGLALTALAYLQRTKPKKELLYRKTVPEGTAIVIHHKKSGTPRLEIVKPKRGRRS
jgi:hypothetical protein